MIPYQFHSSRETWYVAQRSTQGAYHLLASVHKSLEDATRYAVCMTGWGDSEVSDHVREAEGCERAWQPNLALPRIRRRLVDDHAMITLHRDRPRWYDHTTISYAEKCGIRAVRSLGSDQVSWDCDAPMLQLYPACYLTDIQSAALRFKPKDNRLHVRSQKLGLDVDMPVARPFPNRHYLVGGPMSRATAQREKDQMSWYVPCTGRGNVDLEFVWNTQVGRFVHRLTLTLDESGVGNTWSMNHHPYLAPVEVSPRLCVNRDDCSKRRKVTYNYDDHGDLVVNETMTLHPMFLDQTHGSITIEVLWQVDVKNPPSIVDPVTRLSVAGSN